MKKITLIKTLVTICVLLSCNTSFSYDYYEIGKQFYKKGDYKQAETAFNYAINENPYNTKYRYYLAQTYIRLNKVNEAQEEYEKILSINPDSEAAKLAVVGISKLKEYEITLEDTTYTSSETYKKQFSILNKYKYGKSYIDNVVNNSGNILRWSTARMPITVYIEQAKGLRGFRDSYTTLIKRALSAWSEASDGSISFSYSDNQEQSNIRVTYVKHLDARINKGGFTAGISRPHYTTSNKLQYTTVKLLPQTPQGKPFTDAQFYNTVLHEFV